MKIVRSGEAQKFENAASCTAFEYDTHDTDINIARVEIRGRYPLSGSAMNTLVKELVYIEEGSGKVVINSVESAIEKGDVILIEKGERVFWDGTMTLIIACAPAWSPQQYEAAP
jgi:mannose-6-phosphate isomerase-like protein (cupin superfamily)